MGMYDHIEIDIEKLPLPKEVKENFGDNPGFQTKDFECVLTEVYLKDDCIEVAEWEYEEVPVEERPYPNEDGLLLFAGSLRRKNKRMNKITDYHGHVNFYTFCNNENGDEEWYEFNAKYTNGKLEEIIRVTDN